MIPSRKQSRARWRAKRSYMKSIITKSVRREFVERRRSNGTAERRGITEPGIVNQHKQNVRCIRWGFHWTSKSRFGSFQRRFRDTFERLSWTREHRPIPLRIRSDRSRYLRCRYKRSDEQARDSPWHNDFASRCVSRDRKAGQESNTSGRVNRLELMLVGPSDNRNSGAIGEINNCIAFEQ
jgi:hypothetical protein